LGGGRAKELRSRVRSLRECGRVKGRNGCLKDWWLGDQELLKDLNEWTKRNPREEVDTYKRFYSK